MKSLRKHVVQIIIYFCLISVMCFTQIVVMTDVAYAATVIVGNQSQTEQWNYDQGTNTLTLNDFKSSSLYTRAEKSYAIYANSDLVIELTGENKIDLAANYGIYTPGKLTIVGDGILDIANCDYGIYAKEIEIKGDIKITGSANQSILHFIEKLTVDSGYIDVTSPFSSGTYAQILINGGTININTKEAAFNTHAYVTMNDGSIYAKGYSGMGDGLYFTMNGGNATFIGTQDYGMQSAIVINDGSLYVEGEKDGVDQTSLCHEINGGTVNIKSKNDGITGLWGEFKMTGGKLNIEAGRYGINYTYGSRNDVSFSGGEALIHGGYAAMSSGHINFDVAVGDLFVGDDKDNLLYSSQYGEQYYMKILPHSLIKHIGEKPSCTIAGSKSYWTCKVCDKTFSDESCQTEISKADTVVGPTGHTYDASKVTKEATCTEEGVKTFTCTVCGETKTEQIPAKGHTSVTDKSVAPTCTKEGKTEGSHCLSCGKVFVAQKTVKATGHTYKTTTKKATLSINGKIFKKCSKCGDVASTTTIVRPTKFILSTSTYTYDGKIKKPSVTVKNANGKTLLKDTDYTISYASGRKNVGKYSVKITFKGKYSGTKTLYFKINPPKTSISSLTTASKGFIVKWAKKTSQVTGYQVQYSTSNKFANPKTVTVKGYSAVSKKITKLTANKKYYVKVRTYKIVSSTKYYSSWSSYKYVTTKA